jgi:hypothetical protein
VEDSQSLQSAITVYYMTLTVVRLVRSRALILQGEIMKRYFSNFVFALLLIMAGSAVSAAAQEEGALDVHVNKAVAIPGKVLPVGDYVFRLVESTSGANEVKVSSADGETFYGFIPIYRASKNDLTDQAVVKTMADEAGMSRIDTWFFPASHDGFQFIYSKSDLRKLDIIAKQMAARDSANGD